MKLCLNNISPTAPPVLLEPPLSRRSRSNLRTNPDTCIIPNPLSFFLSVDGGQISRKGWIGSAVLLLYCFQLDPSRNTDLISAQILIRSGHKSWHLPPDARCASLLLHLHILLPLLASTYNTQLVTII